MQTETEMDETPQESVEQKPKRVKKEKLSHPILDRVANISKIFLEDWEYAEAPTTEPEFLEWVWSRANVCERCALCEGREQVVKWDGIASADIMVVLEGPGKNENLSGVPLVGPMELRGSRCGYCTRVLDCYSDKLMTTVDGRFKKSKVVTCKPNYVSKQTLLGRYYIRSTGAIFDGILIHKWKMNYPRYNWIVQYDKANAEPWPYPSPWFITNSVLCHSWDKERQKNVPPPAAAKRECKKWLVFQWAAVQPKLILCLGREALGTFISDEKAKQVRPGTILETKFGLILFGLHPSSAMREQNMNIRALSYAKLGNIIEKALATVGYPTEEIK